MGNTFGDALPNPTDSDSLMLAEIGVDGWAAYRSNASAGARVVTAAHVAEGSRLALVLGCDDAGASDAPGGCGSAAVTVLDAATARPLGPASEPLAPLPGPFSAPVDAAWSGGSGLARGKRVALRVELAGAAGVFSFTYSDV